MATTSAAAVSDLARQGGCVLTDYTGTLAGSLCAPAGSPRCEIVNIATARQEDVPSPTSDNSRFDSYDQEELRPVRPFLPLTPAALDRINNEEEFVGLIWTPHGHVSPCTLRFLAELGGIDIEFRRDFIGDMMQMILNLEAQGLERIDIVRRVLYESNVNFDKKLAMSLIDVGIEKYWNSNYSKQNSALPPDCITESYLDLTCG